MAQFTPFPSGQGGAFFPLALQGYAQAGQMQQNRVQQLMQLWQNILSNKIQREQIAAQKHAATKQNELGWGTVGASLLNTTIGPRSIGAGLVANSLAPSLNTLNAVESLQPANMLTNAANVVSNTAKTVDPLMRLGINFNDLVRNQ